MSRKLVIFSDVDGTILNHKTSRPGAARNALQECLFLGIDIVLVSSRNRYEMMNIRRDLGINSPFIYENGGGLIVPRSLAPSLLGATLIGSYWRLSWEGDIASVRLALRRTSKEIGVAIKPLCEMNLSEIADITGLSQAQADLAKYRESDEPFLIEDETPEKVSLLKRHIELAGYCYTSDGKFHHISGNFNKGDKVRFLKSLYMGLASEMVFAAIGDAQNDFSMLKQTNHPFLVRKPGGSFDNSGLFDGVTITDGIGPDGFAEAVNTLIQEYYMVGSSLDRGSLQN